MQRHREDALSTSSLHERIKQLELHTFYGFYEVLRRLAIYEHSDGQKLSQIYAKENELMATIQDILDDETTETADLATLVTVVQGLQQSVTDLQALVAELQASAGGLTPEQQASLDAINAAQDANDATIKSLLPPA